MSTFHILPTDPLAVDAVDLVRELLAEDPQVMVTVRGSSPEGDQDAYVYCVSPAPQDWPAKEYLWGYVSAADWLRDYNWFITA